MAAYADTLLLKIKNRKLFVILAPVIAGVVLGGQIIVAPVLKRINALKFEKDSYAEKEAVYNNIIEWDKKMAPFREQESAGMDKTTLIDQLNSFAGQSSLTLLSITPDERRLFSGNIESMLIRIDAEGNYHQLADFISKAESHKSHIRVTTLEINREATTDQVDLGVATPALPTNSNKNKIYKMSISLTVYFGAKK